MDQQNIQLVPIGEAILSRPGLMQLTSDVNQWDASVLDLVDVAQYTHETTSATSDQNVDIEF